MELTLFAKRIMDKGLELRRMKKFPSFKSAKSIPKDKDESSINNYEKIGKTEKKQSTSLECKEDSSFGKRLDFNNIKTAKSVVNRISEETVNNNDNDFEVLKRRQVEFNRILRKNPKDVSLWIKFINFQDELFMGDTIKQRKLIERKISIVKKGIEMNADALELVFMHLDLAGEIEDSSTLMRIWEKYLNAYKGDAYYKVSMKYLEFIQGRFLAFSYDQVKDSFAQVFRNYKKAPVDLIETLFETFFRFLNRCGYNELIIAIIQALIESNIEEYNYGSVDLGAYEDQWDFGLMDHIGDDVISKGDEGDNFIFDDQNLSVSPLKKWLINERNYEKRLWHPKHFDSDEKVIFDDVKDFILIVNRKEDVLEFLKKLLLDVENILEVDYFLGLRDFFTQIYKSLLPFYGNDWEFTCKCFQLIHKQNPEEAELFTKQHLKENRDSLESFLAYGRFQELIGNEDMAKKVYESLCKRSKEFNRMIEAFTTPLVDSIYKDSKLINLNTNNVTANVYDLVRRNPGDKALYMRIIERIETSNPELAMEVFNLIDEQQLKLFTFLEE